MKQKILERHPDVCSEYSINCRDNEGELRSSLFEVLGLSELFHVLADETRTKILFLLSKQELCVCDLAYLLEMSSPAISHHLRLLKMRHLVRARREGKQVFYTLDDEHVLALIKTSQEHYKEER
ncbi:MAG TPA: ArsR family transcriptional regulator [Sphaerochaeta sp.]|jgi:ArsR family transcriptional regulator|uniref:HTH arsR-type domain-containing protein n=2 Tax=root TaxID=1 RepID=A0A645BK31_9ZZZZ|nr:metalloregulator ArsR/SmtB family transcription factor [Sphaerochaeta pleomorpha]MCK9340483.1 metalloregulator ArsR/SmtB family transcription factor [Synergistaceae bacterium]MDD4449269.1 metalloregulator ArsR/SmtB family transcription factor [Sphaerochaeta sp.]OHD33955.1 MAG: transcriptional regulator [Spirochaetes bacterium GWC2_52_13]PKL20920.1 MAG: ArsR family transcriptional regulator [Spirochaetae bacterium HGW-Spirochaetae-4]PKL27874.1 MAG: ArsR family transcriptional regulator [Spir